MLVETIKILETKESQRKHVYKSGAIYDGSWIEGFRNGYGIQTWPDGSKY